MQNFQTTQNFNKKADLFYEELKSGDNLFKFRETGFNPLKKL